VFESRIGAADRHFPTKTYLLLSLLVERFLSVTSRRSFVVVRGFELTSMGR